MERGRGRKELVRAGQVTTVVPAAAERHVSGSRAVEDLRGSRLLTARADIKPALARAAAALGFDAIAVAAPAIRPGAAEGLAQFLAQGMHGDMGWMAARPERRGDPRTLWPQVRAIVMLGVNYGPRHDPLAVLARRDRGAISVYARATIITT